MGPSDRCQAVEPQPVAAPTGHHLALAGTECNDSNDTFQMFAICQSASIADNKLQ